jgi:hypothetical protein
VRPKNIVCLGNDRELSAFSILATWLNIPNEAIESCVPAGSFRDGRWFDASVPLPRDSSPPLTCRVIGVPHPSRFAPSEALRQFLEREAQHHRSRS